MTTNRRLLAGVFGLSVLLAACGGSGSGTGDGSGGTATEKPATEQPAEATEQPEVTEVPVEETEAPAATDDGSGGGSTTEDPQTLTDLAKKLPREANGITYNRAGFNGDQFGMFTAMAGMDQETLDGVLKANGKAITDVNFAISSPADSSNSTGGFVYVLQIEGVDATKWVDEVAGGTTDMPTSNISGKKVYGQAAMGIGVFYYLKDDMMFIIMMADEATSKDIIGQLP